MSDESLSPRAWSTANARLLDSFGGQRCDVLEILDRANAWANVPEEDFDDEYEAVLDVYCGLAGSDPHPLSLVFDEDECSLWIRRDLNGDLYLLEWTGSEMRIEPLCREHVSRRALDDEEWPPATQRLAHLLPGIADLVS